MDTNEVNISKKLLLPAYTMCLAPKQQCCGAFQQQTENTNCVSVIMAFDIVVYITKNMVAESYWYNLKPSFILLSFGMFFFLLWKISQNVGISFLLHLCPGSSWKEECTVRKAFWMQSWNSILQKGRPLKMENKMEKNEYAWCMMMGRFGAYLALLDSFALFDFWWLSETKSKLYNEQTWSTYYVVKWVRYQAHLCLIYANFVVCK